MRKARVVLLTSLMLASLSGCQVKTVDNSAYVGVAEAYDYSGMRNNDQVFNAEDEKQNIDRGVYKDSIKDQAMADGVPEYPEETEETGEDEEYTIVGSVTNKNQNIKDDESSSGNSSSSGNRNNSSNNNSSSSGNKNNNETKAPNKNNTSSIDTNVSNANSEDKDKNTNKTDDDDNPEKRKNPASMVINGTKYNVYITIDGYYRGNTALRRLNSYNSKHSVEYDMDLPSGYEPVIVQFNVSADEKVPNDDNILIPEIRVRNDSGQKFEDDGEMPTRVSVLRMGDYNDENSSTKSYDAVFEMPADEDGFQLIFGSSSGNTYRFKSSSLDDIDD